MGTLHSLSHTADVGFEVEADSLEELFELAVGGLMACLGVTAGEGAAGERAPGETATGGDESEMEIDRPDLERLLVAWLRELLYRATETSSVPRVQRLAITPPDDGPARLEASVRWMPMEGSGPTREIKGVTYHGLEVARASAAEGWHAQVLLDV